MAILHGEVSEKVVNSFYEVYNTLGYGFLERVYENAMRISLLQHGLEVQQQAPILVHFQGEAVGEYFADFLIGGVVIVEIKAAQALAHEHESQLLNYLKATGYEVGLLLNFGPKPEFRRKVLSSA
jgi:GxxExxY protein